MVTRTYTRGSLATCNPWQLAAEIDTALARTGTHVEIQGLSVLVSHDALIAADDGAINTVIAATVFNPNFGLPAEALTLKSVVPTLRQWATDADTSAASLGTAIGNWTGTTYTAQKDATLKATLQGLQTLTTRLGRLCDRLADVLQVENLN